MLKTSGLCIFCAVFFKLFSELFGRPFFTCQKYFASAIFAQGTPLLYGACSFKLCTFFIRLVTWSCIKDIVGEIMMAFFC